MTSPAIVSDRPRPAVLFFRRLWGLTLRHVFLYLGSWPRLVETLFWPIINMLMLGFASLYLLRSYSTASIIVNVFIAGALLNEIMLRTSMGMMVMFLEEIWSRNLGHMFASPLKIFDYITGILCLSFAKSVISIIPAIFIAIALFGFSLFSLGWPVLAFSLLLIFNGWWYGLLVLALLLRFGLAAEWMAWMALWLVVPVIAPYYPVIVLPGWMQIISWCLPATYVFECMKALVTDHQFHGEYLLKAGALNLVWFTGSAIVFYRAYQGARRRGGLLQVGE